mgnify:FL=1
MKAQKAIVSAKPRSDGVLNMALPGVLTQIGWVLPVSLSEEDWAEAGRNLHRAGSALAWWVGDWANYGRRYGRYVEIAEEIGFTPGTVKQYAYIAQRFESSNRFDSLGFKHHAIVATLPDAQAWLARAAQGKWSARMLEQELDKASTAALLANRAVLPDGKYDVLVIDPPWPIEKIEREVRPRQGEMDYQMMTVEAMGKWKLPMADDCHIWLWTTHKFLPDALALLETWGVAYICTFVWHKPGGFQPFGLPQFNSEFALYGRHGTPSFVDLIDFPTCFMAPRDEHSEKPERFYEIIRRVTSGRRCDLFNRRPILGFDVWGDESGTLAIGQTMGGPTDTSSEAHLGRALDRAAAD